MEESRRRALLIEGRDAFNRGEYYEAHEHWEDVWNEIDDPERRWVQGLIQVATGLHKLERGRPDVCRTLLTKALAKLDGAPDALDGVDVLGARRGATKILAAIARNETPSARAVWLKLSP